MKLIPTLKLGPKNVVLCFLAVSGFALAVAVASDHKPQDSRSAPVKRVPNELRVMEDESSEVPQVVRRLENPLSVNYSVTFHTDGKREYSVTTGNDEAGRMGYQIQTDVDTGSVAPLSEDQEIINPESFVRMSGTRKGMAAISQALAKLVADQPLTIQRVNIPDGGRSWESEGIAIFQADGIVHLVIVRFLGGQPVYEDIGFVAAGCSAQLPPGAGGCSCNASGPNHSCSQGQNGDGSYYAKCKDDVSNSNCTGGGGSCACAPAQ